MIPTNLIPDIGNWFIETYGQNSIKNVRLSPHGTIIIQTDMIKTPALKRLVDHSIEKKFGKIARDNHIDIIIRYTTLK
jgi:hypothetical protein